MIIACPHCQTKYQVTYEAIGSAGRKVQCAQCQQAWQQAPLPQQTAATTNKEMVDSFAEDGLDEAFAAEEKRVAAELATRLADEETHQKSAVAAKIDPATIRSRQRAFSKRQNAIAASQPLAQLRRAVRIGLALLLCAHCASAYFARVQIVARYPAMAGVYEMVGLPVNVVGLDFTDVKTQRSVRNGQEVLAVSAQILGLNDTPTPVPAVVITLLDSHGDSIYAWSIAPSVPDLMAGERATFDTQLAMPPGDAQRVRMSFAENTPVPTTTAAEEQSEPGEAHGADHGAATAAHPTTATVEEAHPAAHGSTSNHPEEHPAPPTEHDTGSHATSIPEHH
jgi:predicted Zn finger-like uncharacterized protein